MFPQAHLQLSSHIATFALLPCRTMGEKSKRDEADVLMGTSKRRREEMQTEIERSTKLIKANEKDEMKLRSTWVMTIGEDLMLKNQKVSPEIKKTIISSIRRHHMKEDHEKKERQRTLIIAVLTEEKAAKFWAEQQKEGALDALDADVHEALSAFIDRDRASQNRWQVPVTPPTPLPQPDTPEM